MSEQQRKVNQTYINYLSAVSHGKSARKVEKLREKTVNIIFDTRMKIAGTPPYKGDRVLRDATVSYFKTCYIVFNEDYGKIVNMEEIAEQSYDAMEAYLLAQEKAGEKLEEAAKLQYETAKKFAQAHNIQILESKDELDLKMEKSDKVNEYYNKLFLIFFKSSKQDAYLTEAINVSDVNAVEQNRNALLNFSTTGLEQLSSINAFQSDASLLTACKKVLQFYKEMSQKKMESISNFIVINGNFKKLKKSFDSKPSNQRKEGDIDAYNKGIGEINKASNAYNKANNEINSDRNAMIKLWNSSVKNFMDTHMPYAR